MHLGKARNALIVGVQIIATKMFVFEQKLFEYDRSSFSAGYVKHLRRGNSQIEALFA